MAAKKGNKKSRNLLLIMVALLTLTGILFALPRMGGKQSVASAVELPAWLKQYPPEVREAYAYAAEHQDILEYMACYCGCQNHGHTGNASCYIKNMDANGEIEWDSHAAT